MSEKLKFIFGIPGIGRDCEHCSKGLAIAERYVKAGTEGAIYIRPKGGELLRSYDWGNVRVAYCLSDHYEGPDGKQIVGPGCEVNEGECLGGKTIACHFMEVE